ncbi:MAG TPA: c-type cytochrome [Anaerolineales bacterium]|nr:c-type cytochrome [Anaerolineales bacterium]
MKKFMKSAGIVLGGLFVLIALAGLVLYAIGMKKLTRMYPNIAVETINVPTDTEAIARGEHVATIWSCTKCHGTNLSGTLITNDPIEGSIPTLGVITASNLTSGNGGIAASYTDIDWVRAIRHGVKPNSQVEIYMYAYFSTMSDQDLGDLIAYLKQVPPVDSDTPAMRYGPIIPIFPALGMFTPAAELIDHSAPHPADTIPGTTKEYGKYLSAICTGCHDNDIGKVVKKWKQGEFIHTFNSSVLPDGKQLGPTMSSDAFRKMNDMELTALWLYFTNAQP